MVLLRILAFIVGLFLVGVALSSAIRTFVLPRSAPDIIVKIVFRNIWRRIFNVVVDRAKTYDERDNIMALYAPVGLMSLVPAWLIIILVGYMGMYWAVGVDSLWTTFALSGSSLLTLGFEAVHDIPSTILAFTEAALGLIMVALLIAYLPTIYTAFSRREAAVTMLEVRAGSPPSALEMLLRFNRISGWDSLHDLWISWEMWFADIEETHTSLASLPFFRSPQGHRSWITSAGAILDSAAITMSALDLPKDAQAALCIRAGYIALRRICDYFNIPYNSNPKPDDPISIRRDEFDAVLDQLAAQNVPMKPDRDQAWRDFCGWRVNYDTVLLALAGITMAPYAPWSSDRSLLRPRRRGRPMRKAPSVPTPAPPIPKPEHKG